MPGIEHWVLLEKQSMISSFAVPATFCLQKLVTCIYPNILKIQAEGLTELSLGHSPQA